MTESKDQGGKLCKFVGTVGALLLPPFPALNTLQGWTIEVLGCALLSAMQCHASSLSSCLHPSRLDQD